MSASPLGGGRLRAFRLSEVPIEIRDRHARRLARRAVSPLERVAYDMAAHRPSDRVYSVTRGAWDRVVGS